MRMVGADGSGRAEVGVDAESEAILCERNPPEKKSARERGRAKPHARIAKIESSNLRTCKPLNSSSIYCVGVELPQIPLLDLLHERLAAEEVALEIRRELPGHNENLIVRDCGKVNRPASRDQMRTPLKNEAGIPDCK